MLSVWLSTVTLLLMFLPFLSFLQSLWGLYRRCKMTRNIPGLPSHWLWGNLQQIQLNRPTIQRWVDYIQGNRHRMVKLWFGPFIPAVVVTHCSLVKTVIALPKDMYAYSFIKPWLGEGLASSDVKWFRNCRLITPAFHYEILRAYVPVSTAV